MRRSLRRWKTFKAKNNRKKELARSWGGEYNVHPKFLEHPTCDCHMCNKKKGWNHKTRKRKMRDGERKAIREFYKEDFSNWASDLLEKIFGEQDPYRD